MCCWWRSTEFHRCVYESQKICKDVQRMLNWFVCSSLSAMHLIQCLSTFCSIGFPDNSNWLSITSNSFPMDSRIGQWSSDAFNWFPFVVRWLPIDVQLFTRCSTYLRWQPIGFQWRGRAKPVRSKPARVFKNCWMFGFHHILTPNHLQRPACASDFMLSLSKPQASFGRRAACC